MYKKNNNNNNLVSSNCYGNKIRGNIQQIIGKYRSMAKNTRDFDEIMCENFKQYIDHYTRVVSSKNNLNNRDKKSPIKSNIKITTVSNNNASSKIIKENKNLPKQVVSKSKEKLQPLNNNQKAPHVVKANTAKVKSSEVKKKSKKTIKSDKKDIK